MPYLLLIIFLGSLTFADEPSVFNAGNIESKKPYGLNKVERSILKNKKTISQVKDKLFKANTGINKLQENIEGLKSISRASGENIKIIRTDLHRLKQQLQSLEKNRKLDLKASEFRQKAVLSDFNDSLTKNNLQIIKLLQSRTSILTQDLNNLVQNVQSLEQDIKANYISKQDFNVRMQKVVNQFNKQIQLLTTGLNETNKNNNVQIQILTKALNDNNIKIAQSQNAVAKLQNLANEAQNLAAEAQNVAVEAKAVSETALQESSKKPPQPLKTKDNKTIFKKGEKYYIAKQYAKSRDAFLVLAKKNNKYQEALSLYYLGESFYQLQNYKNAIAYFKQSARLNDRAKYIPKLLYHTGFSFEKLNNKKEARNFYETLINLYPKSFFNKYAKQRLEKIN